MTVLAGLRRALLTAITLAGITLTGCSTTTQAGSPPMMNGPGSTATGTDSASMMGGASGYHYSRLTCAAPTTLPGHRVTASPSCSPTWA